jgi:hypothetical protein
MFGFECRNAGLAAAMCMEAERDVMLAIAKAAGDVTPNEAAYLSFVFGYGMPAHEARRRCASG